MKRVRHFFVRLLRRVRYSGGHGIHSPFAFDFVMNIVYNPCPYYFFDTPPPMWQHPHRQLSPRTERKVRELLFRMVEHYRLSRIVVVGEQHPTFAAYCTAPSAAIKLNRIESVELLDSPSLILLDDVRTKEEWLGLYEEVKRKSGEATVLVLPALHADRGKKWMWHELCKDPFVRVTFDLYDVGVVFCRKKLHKKNYIVAF